MVFHQFSQGLPGLVIRGVRLKNKLVVVFNETGIFLQVYPDLNLWPQRGSKPIVTAPPLIAKALSCCADTGPYRLPFTA